MKYLWILLIVPFVASCGGGMMQLDGAELVGERIAEPEPWPIAAEKPLYVPPAPPVTEFTTESAEIDDGAYRALAAFGDKVRHLPLYVIGFTDSRGDPNYNALLGLKRAKAVAAVLRQSGVPEAMITIVTRGETHQIAGVDREDGFAHSRRVEILFK